MTVDTAESGAECLDILKQKKYDLIFMDHMMPDMDGVETMQHIREQGLCDEAPIVVVTANAIVGVEQDMRKLGFDGYVSKPIDMNVLEKELVRLLPSDKIRQIDDEAVKAKQSENKPEKRMKKVDEYALKALKTLLEECGVDAEVGLTNCSDSDEYLELLNAAVADMPDRIMNLDKCYAERNIERYTELVHTIKCNCATLGAMYVSEQAKKLEMAGNEKDVQYIEVKAERFYNEYVKLKAGLEMALAKYTSQ
jgi:CheY-like chemotaxis protein/HPt (histidine-containing phosphotransfer) domain-containing protein